MGCYGLLKIYDKFNGDFNTSETDGLYMLCCYVAMKEKIYDELNY